MNFFFCVEKRVVFRRQLGRRNDIIIWLVRKERRVERGQKDFVFFLSGSLRLKALEGSWRKACITPIGK